MLLIAMTTNRARTMKTLIVDDEPVVRQTLKLILEFLGHQIEESADGLSGLEKMQGVHYDVIFVDIRMPRLTELVS